MAFAKNLDCSVGNVVISALRKEESRSRIRGGEPVFRRRKSVSRDISLTDRFQLVHARNLAYRSYYDRPTVARFSHKMARSQCFRANFESSIMFMFFLSFLRPLLLCCFLQHLHDLERVIISNNFHPIGNNREIHRSLKRDG